MSKSEHELKQTDGSGLFCTPPPEKALGCVDCTVGEDVYILEVPNLQEEQNLELLRRRLCPKACNVLDTSRDSVVDRFQPLLPSQNHFFVALSYSDGGSSLKVSSKNPDEDHYEVAAGRCDLESIDPIMTDPSASLTTFTASTEMAQASARSHLSNRTTDNPKISPSNIKTSQKTIQPSVGNGPAHDLTFLCQFTGCSSSDDEDQDDTSCAETERVEHHESHIEIKSRNRNSTVIVESAEHLTDSSSKQKDHPARPSLLLQRQEMNARSCGGQILSTTAEETNSLFRILKPSRVKTATFLPTAIRSKQSASRTLRRESHVDMAVQSGVTVPKKRPISSSISMQSTKRPKLHGPFVDDSESEDEHDNDHFEGSISSSRLNLYEKEPETFEDDEQDLEHSPATPPPKRSLPSMQDPKSSRSTKTTKPVDVLKLRKLMLPKQQIQPRKNTSSSDTSTVQRNRAAPDTSSVTCAQTSVRGSQGPISLATTTLRAGPSPVWQGVRNGFDPKESGVQTTTKAAPQASRLGSANATASMSHSTSGNSAPKISRPNATTQGISNASQTGPVASAPTSQAARNLPKKRQGAANGLIAIKPRTRAAASLQDSHSSARAIGGSRVLGDLLQDSRQAGEPPNSSNQPSSAQPSMQGKTPNHLDRAAGCPETVDNTESMQAEDDMVKSGPSSIPSSFAHESPPSMMAKDQASSLEANSKRSMVHGGSSPPGTRTVTPGANTTGYTVPKLQTSQSTPSVSKRKIAATDTSSSSDLPASKRPMMASVLRSPIAQSGVDPCNIATRNQTQFLPSMIKVNSAATATRNFMEAVPSTPAIKPNMHANNPRTTVYKTLHTPPGTIDQHIDHPTPRKVDQLAAPQPKQLPLLKQNTGTSSSKATSSPINTPVKSQAVSSQPRTGTPPRNTVSIQIPVKVGYTTAAIVPEDAAAPKIVQTMLQPNLVRTSVDTVKNNLGRMPSQTAISRERKRVHEETAQSVSGPDGTSDSNPNVTSIAKRRTTADSDDAKIQGCLAKRKNVILNSDFPWQSNALSAEEAAESTAVQPSMDGLDLIVESPAEVMASRVDPTSGERRGDAQQSKAKASEKCSNIARSAPGSGSQYQALKKIPQVVPETSAAISDSAEPHVQGKSEPRGATTVSILTPSDLRTSTHEEDSSPVVILPIAPAVPTNAEPYFEYSVCRKLWCDTDSDSSIAATELTSTPCTNIDEANAHVQSLFNDARQQYQQHFHVQFSKWVNEPDEHGCNVFVGTFAPIDNPSKISWMKYWVQRDQVSAHAGRKTKDLKSTSFVSKTVYVLRLFKLQPAITNPDVEQASATAAAIRIHHPLPRTECYTTLDAANRAAKNLQIELSHKPNPTAMDKAWQTMSRAELNKKLNELPQANDEDGRYWKSGFNGSGPGSATFELVVEKAGLCGPRNF